MSVTEKYVPKADREDETDDRFSKNIVASRQSSAYLNEQYEDLIDRSVALGLENARSYIAPNDRFESLRFSEHNSVTPARIFDSPPPITSKADVPIVFEKLQEWEGYVLEIGSEEFTARLVDLTLGQSTADEEANFLLEDLTDDDVELLAVGSIFRWIIGYQRYSGGPKQRVSQLVFRRIPAWTQRDFDYAESAGEELYESVDWE